MVEDILYPCGHRDGADVPCLSLQIDNGPVFFTLLNVAEVQLNCLMARQATRKQDGQKCSIALFLQALTAGSLPQALRLFGGEPVSEPHADLLDALHSSDAGSQIRAKEPTVGSLIGQTHRP